MSAESTAGSYGLPTKPAFKLPEIITAASAGTVIDWYDFYIFGTLTPIISPFFFPNAAGDPILSLLVGLLTFWVGFAVRPFGAIVFGRIGDLIGRKYTFLITLIIMGGATTVIGLIPSYATIGMAAPLILVGLRILQGLALGGEYGGAAIYVAEHAPDGQRGYHTSWIQTTATLGLFVSLAVILAVRLSMTPEQFADPGPTGGWRIPFLLSFVLVLGSLYIRLRLRESPLYTALKESGKTSTQPLKESLGTKRNWKLIALALFGAVAGQGVVWYTGQFYALTFLTAILKVPTNQAYVIVSIALLLGTPFFVIFGSLSDRIGRKKIMMAGLALAVVLYAPIYWLMTQSVTLPPAGSPPTATSTDVNSVALVLLIFVQLLFATMAYGPIAAFLVELFPARIRYTSLSLPYHLGNGVIGGLVPFIATATVAATGNLIAGVFYPIAIAAITLVIGLKFLPETTHTRIWDEVQDAEAPGDGRTPLPA
jgi:MFS family permease